MTADFLVLGLLVDKKKSATHNKVIRLFTQTFTSYEVTMRLPKNLSEDCQLNID
jgi:hypothetical protein